MKLQIQKHRNYREWYQTKTYKKEKLSYTNRASGTEDVTEKTKITMKLALHTVASGYNEVFYETKIESGHR